MAVLVGGQTWGLLGSKNSSKSVVVVKLTDASLHALEDYIANESSQKPKITFPSSQHESGHISIPLGNDGSKAATFSFTLSSLEDSQGPNGSFECLQTSTSTHGQLESVGLLQQKLQLHASDDSYTRFEQKMFEAKKESEKRTTQFLDRRPAASAYVRKRPQFQTSQCSAIAPPQRSRPSGFLPGTHPMLERKRPAVAVNNPDLMRRPLRERIIHLLAVRPFKKPELLSRINRDGVLEKDRKNISTILKQVSFMKDNTYHLLRYIWNDVSEDWPFYSEQERQQFRRRKPQNLTPPCSDGSTSSSGRSPSSTHPPSPPRPLMRSSPAKRPFGLEAGEGNASKIRRVSKYVRSESPAGKVIGMREGDSTVMMSRQDMEDWSKKYPPISVKEQRDRYKKEFHDDYNQYMKLHVYLERISARFDDLGKRLHSLQPDSEEYQRLKAIIVNEYREKRDKKFLEAKADYQRLRSKLNYIKKLVADYDSRNVMAL